MHIALRTGSWNWRKAQKVVNFKRINFVRREKGYTQPSSSLTGDQDRFYGKNVKNGPIFVSTETLSYIHLTLRTSFDSHEYGKN